MEGIPRRSSRYNVVISRPHLVRECTSDVCRHRTHAPYQSSSCRIACNAGAGRGGCVQLPVAWV